MIDPEKVKSVRIAACDLNGQMRGKRLPGFEEEKFKIGRDYPAPIVKHEDARSKALGAFKKI